MNPKGGMLMLPEKSIDIIREVINVGIGDAAAALSELVNTRIVVEVPDILIMDSGDTPGYLQREIKSLGVYICQDFHGFFTGKTILFYTKENSISLLNSLDGEVRYTSTLTESGMATLQEIGNIILVSCISTISDMMEGKILFEMPHVTSEVSDGYFQNLLEGLTEFDKVIVIKNYMTVKEKDIKGYMFILLGLSDLKMIVEKLEGKLTEGG